MSQVIDLVMELAARLPPDQVAAIANRVRDFSGTYEPWGVKTLVSSQWAKERVDVLLKEWVTSEFSGEYLAGLLVGASVARQKVLNESTTEIVWTGPKTDFVSLRRTDVVLVDMINGAKKELFLVSFVVYSVPKIVEALRYAIARGVRIRCLFESSQEDGGSLEYDPLATMQDAIPKAELYAWREKEAQHERGRVHAKVAVVDERVALVSSANLTGYAMAQNMEAGVLITGGSVPRDLSRHLQALVETRHIVCI